MWDASADGYGRGEGGVVVALKPLRQAIADRDNIECVLRQSGVNQNGHSSLGLTVPSAAAQTDLIRSTYQQAGLDPLSDEGRCQFFEAHGTGTLAGDPKEAEAIRDTFFPEISGQTRSSSQAGGSSSFTDNSLLVGSVKTIIGHSEGAAGLLSLLKVSLALKHATIPPNMHFTQISPEVEPYYHPHLCIPTELTPWPNLPADSPRRASINSFGFGGTNSHVIVESWDPNLDRATHVEEPIISRPPTVFTLSAKSKFSLLRIIAALSTFLKQQNEINMQDLAWSLSRRTEFPVRAAFAAVDKEDLIQKLDSITTNTTNESLLDSNIVTSPVHVCQRFPLRILGIFTGQGAQWPSMGAQLYAKCELFRETISQLDLLLSGLSGFQDWSIAEQLAAPAASSKVHLSHVSQPVTTALQIALVDLMKASGVMFAAVVGHSSGEIAALYAAGRLSACDAMRIAYYRSVSISICGYTNGYLDY